MHGLGAVVDEGAEGSGEYRGDSDRTGAQMSLRSLGRSGTRRGRGPSTVQIPSFSSCQSGCPGCRGRRDGPRSPSSGLRGSRTPAGRG